MSGDKGKRLLSETSLLKVLFSPSVILNWFFQNPSGHLIFPFCTENTKQNSSVNNSPASGFAKQRVIQSHAVLNGISMNSDQSRCFLKKEFYRKIPLFNQHSSLAFQLSQDLYPRTEQWFSTEQNIQNFCTRTRRCSQLIVSIPPVAELKHEAA